MIFKIIFITIFSILFLYALARPFSSKSARLFLLVGSVLGVLSLIGIEYAQVVAEVLGIGRAVDVYLYLGLVTIFLFIIYTLNKVKQFNEKISLLVKQIALEEKEFPKKQKQK